MRRRATITTFLTLLLLPPGLAVTTAGPVRADEDLTPPTVQLDPWAHPSVGSQVEVIHDNRNGFTVWGADFEINWSAADASGICAQAVGWSSYDALGDDTEPLIGAPTTYFAVDPTARSFLAPGLDLFDWSRIRDRFIVRVTDCAGNVAYTNVADSEFGINEDTAHTVRYRGRWRIARSEEFAGGTTHATSTPGARAIFGFSGSAPIALVMDTGPDRGEADVYVDGTLVATVDTYASTARHRVVVWQDRFGPGTHRLELVNRATEGRPRIDLDLISSCPGEGSCLSG
jgi:hypothetical protein